MRELRSSFLTIIPRFAIFRPITYDFRSVTALQTGKFRKHTLGSQIMQEIPSFCSTQ
jgi:hypothetical protein